MSCGKKIVATLLRSLSAWAVCSRLCARCLPSFQAAAIGPSPYADTVLLLPAPGEQHTLGLVILSEFFRREGWQVVGGPVSNGAGTADLVRSTWVDVVGFSLGSTRHLDGLAASIRGVRAASRNRYLGVMVGGPLFLQRPDLVRRVGADTTAVRCPDRDAAGKKLVGDAGSGRLTISHGPGDQRGGFR